MENVVSKSSNSGKDENLSSDNKSFMASMETDADSKINIVESIAITEELLNSAEDRLKQPLESRVVDNSKNKEHHNIGSVPNTTKYDASVESQNDGISIHRTPEKRETEFVDVQRLQTQPTVNINNDQQSRDLNNLLVEVTRTLDSMRAVISSYVAQQQQSSMAANSSPDDRPTQRLAQVGQPVYDSKSIDIVANEDNYSMINEDQLPPATASGKSKMVKPTSDREQTKPAAAVPDRKPAIKSKVRHLSMCPLYEPSPLDDLKENYYDALRDFTKLRDEAQTTSVRVDSSIDGKLNTVARLIDEINSKLDDPNYVCESDICHLLQQQRHAGLGGKNMAKASFGQRKLNRQTGSVNVKKGQMKYAGAATSTEYRDNFKDPRALTLGPARPLNAAGLGLPNNNFGPSAVRRKRRSDPNIKPFPAEDFQFHTKYGKEKEKRRLEETEDEAETDVSLEYTEDQPLCTCALIEEYYRQHGCSYINHNGHIIVIDCPSDSDDDSQCSSIYDT